MAKKKSVKTKADPIAEAKALLEANGHKVVPVTAGQPTKYDPKYCQLLVDHMSTGRSFESFAAVADVTRSTLYNWEKDHPEFLDAHKRGDDQRLNYMEMTGLTGMGGRLPGFSASTWIFAMKNIAKWTDRQDVTSGDAPLPVQPATVTVYLPSNGRDKK